MIDKIESSMYRQVRNHRTIRIVDLSVKKYILHGGTTYCIVSTILTRTTHHDYHLQTYVGEEHWVRKGV